MSEPNEPNPLVRIRHAASGQVLELPSRGVAELIRSGKLGPLDQVLSASGAFVPWWEIPQFAALRSEVRTGSPSTGPLPATPSLRTTDPGSRRVPVPDATPVAPPAPSPSLSSGARRVAAAAPPTRGSAGTTETPSTIGARSPFASARLDDGPEALRDLLVGCTFEDIFGLPDSAPNARIQAAYAERVAAIEAAWTPDDPSMRTPAARNARLDVLRILAAALRTLTLADERKQYDERARALGRPPRFRDVVDFAPAAVPRTRDEERGVSMSESDEAILRYVGFDTQKIREAHAPKKKPAGRAEARQEARPDVRTARPEPSLDAAFETPPRAAAGRHAVPPQRQIGWAAIAIVAIILLILSWVPRCTGADEEAAGRMVTLDEESAE